MKCLRTANALLRGSTATSGTLSRSVSIAYTRTIIASASANATCRSQLRLSSYSLPESNAYSSSTGSSRSFSQTTRCSKKKDKEEKQERRGGRNNASAEPPAVKEKEKGAGSKKAAESPSSSSSPADANRPVPDSSKPFDLADLTYAFDKADRHFTEDLKKQRVGSRFNADVMGAIPVQPDKKNPQTFPLRELATVSPLTGRKWSIMAFEEESVKPIMSAIQKSDDFNQQPQRSEDNPLELTISVEPERAEALVKRAKDACHAWRNKIRDESHKREGVHKRWHAAKLVTKDDVVTLREKVHKAQEDRMKVIAQREKEALQQIAARAG
ncbi:ribosome recycling factor domain-containing protein [Bombardia bombarda]|uniref:Ribosome recycling factor domain-containing protein n=1 Tax=Bombardia bombarda TaxID=252184 RepID=A0AA39WMG9_9PEZI|nr:ribosome recycling factor domain-containing protein [Bombardia bombarda]